MSRESDDNLSSINSTYTDMYQETVKRFTRSSLSPEMDRYSTPSSRISTKSTTTSFKSSNDDRRTSFDYYLEATGRRRSSDHGAVLTADTEQFIIGQRVWVGGIRSGQIAYIGETHFAPGEWAGIVLDEPNGKNDGCVAGKRYFQCEPKRGIFSRLTRLTLSPLAGAYTPTSPLSKFSPERSRTVSPTASIRSSFLRSPGGKNGLTVGDRVIVSSGFGSRPGILRYLGETQFASGNWCGVELDENSGKNDGSVDGIKYFECKPKYGVFVPIAKVSLSPSSKKTRLSRTGSRESLTSIGTMNSIATTNTSRMRMSAQRKPSSIKPVSTPKSQFSMQDLLREKQNHIEQLMIERDLDREDAQTQALQFQKNISELKARVTQLDRKLEDERKKSEDLQFSIDEATFCGDELNAQTQVYKEKVHELERKITHLNSTGPPSLQTPLPQDNSVAIAEATATANAQIVELSAQLNEQAKTYEARINEVEDEEKRLLENIKYLQTQNETLQTELLGKDESLEKFSLSESGIDNLRRELTLLKEENEKERKQTIAEFTEKLDAKNLEVKRLSEELVIVKNSFGSLEGERTNVEDECEILRAECKNRDGNMQNLNDQIAKLTAELSVQMAESATLNELLKEQQTGNVQDKTALEQKVAEITKLNTNITELQGTKSTLEANLRMAGEELQKLGEMQKMFEEKLNEATSADQEKLSAMKLLEAAMDELKKQVQETNTENALLHEKLKSLGESHVSVKAREEFLQKELEAKDKINFAGAAELRTTEEALAKLQTELTEYKAKSVEILTSKTQEIEQFQIEIAQLQQKTRTLEGESTTTVQQMSGRVRDLETQLKNVQQSLKVSEEELSLQRQERAKQASSIAEKLTELKDTSTSLDATKKMLEKLQQEHEKSLTKSNELEELLKQSEVQSAQQQLLHGDLTRKHEALSAKCESLITQNEALQQDILAARTSGSEVQTEVRKLNDEIVAKQKAFTELQNDNSTERIKFESQIEELQQKLTNAGKDATELKDNWQKTKEELAKKNEQLTALEERTIKQELSLSDVQRQQENLQTKYDALVAQNESLQNDLTMLRSTSTDSNAELLKLSQNVATKQKNYEDLLDKTSAERASLEGQLQASQQRIDALCSQVETLTQELKSASDESFKRFELHKQEQEKCSKQELELGNLTRQLESFHTKCENLQTQNEGLQKDLSLLGTTSTDANAEVVKLTAELAKKQKLQQELTDKTSAERMQLESQLQELTQRCQTVQNEVESLRTELQITTDAKAQQSTEFESLKVELHASSLKELEEVKKLQSDDRKKLIESFEQQLKSAEATKSNLDEAISSLQTQIQLLQDELLKSQLHFRSKEDELSRQLAAYSAEKIQLANTLQQVQTAGTTTLSTIEQEKAALLLHIQKLTQESKEKDEQLQSAHGVAEQLKIVQSNTTGELTKLETEVKTLQTALEISNNDIEHKAKLAEADTKKIEELKSMLEAVQKSNSNISATNAELAEALQLLEQEKCETANIFELFEMESDQNAAQLIEKLSNMKQALADAQTQLLSKDTEIAEIQSNILEQTTKLSELKQANAELKQALGDKDTDKQQRQEIESQLAEYKSMFDEMDDASMEKTSELSQLQAQTQQLQSELQQMLEQNKALKNEYTSLQRRAESADLEKTREMVTLQARIKDLQSISNGASTSAIVDMSDNNDSTAQINFLNSIIADMQKKNDTLKSKIEALEALPTDFTKPSAFDLISKRKPAPRVFCDICDVFDAHETEDCPLQASDDREYTPPLSAETNNNDPANKKERKLPEQRKYCDSCEVFGHATNECMDDECF